MPDRDDTNSRPDRSEPALWLAVGMVLLEAVALLAYAGAGLWAARTGDVTVAVSTGGFFAVYACVHGVAARGLWRREQWARGLVVATQLLQLGVAWSLRADPGTLFALVLAGVGLTVLASVLSPSVTRALGE